MMWARFLRVSWKLRKECKENPGTPGFRTYIRPHLSMQKNNKWAIKRYFKIPERNKRNTKEKRILFVKMIAKIGGNGNQQLHCAQGKKRTGTPWRNESCADEIKVCNKWATENNGKEAEGNEYYNMVQNTITNRYNYYNMNESSGEYLKQLSQIAQNKKTKHKENKMMRGDS